MRVVLRAVGESDDKALAAMAADPDVRLWNPMRPEEAAAWRDRFACEEKTLTFAITEASDPSALLGTIALFDVDHEQGTAELGYRVHPDARGRGAATGAVAAAVDHAFAGLGLRRLMLYHAVANPASCAVAERNGFRLEGTLREGYVYGDGVAYDEHLHARLATD